MKIVVMTMGLMMFTLGAQAQDTTAAPQDHSMHQAAPTATPAAGMGMEEMQGMMKECMAQNKNGKMCGKKMMSKCQENMDKKQCRHMMKKMKHSKGPKGKNKHK